MRIETLRKLLTAVAACLLVALPAAAHAGPPHDFFGLVSEDVFAGDAAYRDATLAQQADAGVGLIRQTFHWKDIEVRRGVYNWAAYDAYMAATASHGIRVLPILFEPPRFRAHASASGRGSYPPKHYADIGKFGAAVARRYGPNGTFWQQNPALPKLPIGAYQIWNEPNLKVYWASGPNPRQYARLLKAAASGIHAADPSAEIVSAGLPDSRLSTPKNVYGWVKALLHAGAGRSIDSLAVNPYAKDRSGMLGKLRHFRRLLNAGGARNAKIWVTEFGWSDRGPAAPFRAGSTGQARLISQTIPALVHARGSLRLRGFVYYAWRDGAPYAPLFRDFWGLHTGLLRLNGHPKPALAAFKATIAKVR
jgi:polysaccharide biosynthesis protein PslG